MRHKKLIPAFSNTRRQQKRWIIHGANNIAIESVVLASIWAAWCRFQVEVFHLKSLQPSRSSVFSNITVSGPVTIQERQKIEVGNIGRTWHLQTPS
jgi:hypothetical protein